jgi:hypothetical protein
MVIQLHAIALVLAAAVMGTAALTLMLVSGN